ncbi:hypothetical protein RDWZM_004885 [Blomia tropicalis]|uniref:Uncharacterized protein n=1 Tax=Blomia tropicalis TaxID=40697 RepID=A0A9Q0M5N6_BLOTA|nr:hypothetical protein RDWZM_004885 [Blomia tropicalis]
MIGPMEGKSANNNGKHLLLVDKEMNMMILNLSSFSKDGISSDQNLQLSPIKDKWSKFEIELQSFTKEQTEFGMYSHLVKSGDNAEIVVYSKVKNTNNAKFAIIKYVIGSVKVTKQDLIIDKDPKASLLSNFTVPESGATEYSLIKVSNSKGLMVGKVIVNDTAITTVNGSEMNLCSHKNSENADDKNWAKFSIADCKKDELMKWKLNTGFLNKKMMYLLTDHGLQSIPMDKFLGKSEDPFQYDSVSNENLINNKVTTPDPNSPAPNDPTDPNSILSFSSSSTYRNADTNDINSFALIDKDMRVLAIPFSSISQNGISLQPDSKFETVKEKWPKFDKELKTFVEKNPKYDLYSRSVANKDIKVLIVMISKDVNDKKKHALIKEAPNTDTPTKTEMEIPDAFNLKAMVLSNTTAPNFNDQSYYLTQVVDHSLGNESLKLIHILYEGKTVKLDSEKYMCLITNNSKNQLKFSKNKCSKNDTIKWKVFTGFSHKNTVYLFTDSGMNSFSIDNFFKDTEDPFSYTTAKNDDLFKCDKANNTNPNGTNPNHNGSAHFPTISSTTSKSKVLIIIIILIIIILIIICCIILCCCCGKKKNKSEEDNKSNKNKNGNKNKKKVNSKPPVAKSKIDKHDSRAKSKIKTVSSDSNVKEIKKNRNKSKIGDNGKMKNKSKIGDNGKMKNKSKIGDNGKNKNKSKIVPVISKPPKKVQPKKSSESNGPNSSMSKMSNKGKERGPKSSGKSDAFDSATSMASNKSYLSKTSANNPYKPQNSSSSSSTSSNTRDLKSVISVK